MGGSLVLACGDCAAAHPPPESRPLAVFFLIALLLVLGALILLVQRRRKRRPRTVSDRWSALAVMGELCPQGWQAEITVRGSGAPLPPDAPRGPRPPVAVEWKIYEEASGEVTLTRRVWAETVEQALQKMVEERHLDLELEQIEQSVIPTEKEP
jgi:hypothetical protein